MNLAVWLGGALCVVRLAFVESINWEWLKYKLSTPDRETAARIIVEKWAERPRDFFKGIEEDSWRVIIPMLSPEKIALIRGGNFEHSLAACQAFAGYLPEILSGEPFPEMFRLAVYEFLDGINVWGVDTLPNTDPATWMNMYGMNPTDDVLFMTSPRLLDPENEERLQNCKKKRVQAILDAIPHLWLINDGDIVMRFLVSSTPPRLSLLKPMSLRVLFQNPQRACRRLTLTMLKSLSLAQQSLITDKCMAAIEGLGTMDLSMIVGNLPRNIFARYSGALARETIENMSGPQLAAFGSRVGEPARICESLELHYFSLSAFEWVSARCIYGYLGQKWEKGLGDRWGRVDPLKLYQISPDMQKNLLNIHPRDFALMPSRVLRALFTFEQVCSHVELSFLSPEMIKSMPAPCLHKILTRPNPPISLGRLWSGLSYETMVEFDEEMIRAIKNIAVSDFAFMQGSLLHLMLVSPEALRNLPQPTERIVLLIDADTLLFTPEQFAAITKAAPNVAGQLLMLKWNVPMDILSFLESETIRKLSYIVPEREKLDWRGLFESLEMSKGGFSGIVAKMSTKAKRHFCSTIKNVEEYLSLPWLCRNMNSACRSNILFDTTDTQVLLKAPELAVEGAIPWQAMLERYKLQDWAKISANKEFAMKLGKVCEFWSVAGTQRHSVIKALHPEAPKYIESRCVFQLGRFLMENVNFISLLAEDAFAFHQAGDLPFSIKELLPGQLALLSKGGSLDSHTLSSALSRVSLEELESLTFVQFRVLLTAQWTCLPDGIKYLALNAHSRRAEFILTNFILDDAKEEQESPRLSQETLIDALNLFAVMQRGGYVHSKDSILEKLLATAEQSGSKHHLFDLLSQSDLPRAVLTTGGGISKGDATLGDKFREAEKEMEGLLLTFNNVSGFNRIGTFNLFVSFPKVFSSTHSLVGDERVVRMLVAQILDDVKRDLVVWEKLSQRGKFVWGISSQAGFMVGFAVGKAVQLGIQLPFVLDRGFFSLLANPSDEAIQQYYETSYAKETLIHRLFAKSQWPMTTIDQIRFAKQSMRDSWRGAACDRSAKFNLFAHRSKAEARVIHTSNEAEQLQAYITAINKRILAEFGEFVREIKRGLSYPLPRLWAPETPPPATAYYNRLAVFLPMVLGPRFINGNEIADKVQFLGDRKIPSIVKGQFIDASKVVSAFIRSLDGGQSSRLLAILTGVSRPCLDQIRLRVYFEYPTRRPVIVDLCRVVELEARREERLMVPPGRDYISFFHRVSQNLLGPSTKVKPECATLGNIGVYSVEVRPSPARLYVKLQPAWALILSLVEMINTKTVVLEKL